MKALGIATIGLLAVHATAWQHSDAAELRQQLSNNDRTLVAFVAPQTKSSKALLPEWKAIRANATLKSIDCSASRDLCAELDVVSFPTIRLYQRDRAMIRYRGPRRASSIISFLKRTERPSVTYLNKETIDGFSTTDSVVFVAHIHRDDDSLLSRYSSLATAYQDRYTFAVAQGIQTGPSTLQCHNHLDGEEHIETNLDSVGALEAFVATCTEPLIPELGRRTELKYTQTGKSMVFYCSDVQAEREAYSAAMKPLAKMYREYLQFVTVDSGEYPEMPRTLGIASKTGLAVENPHTGQVFPYRNKGSSGVALTEAEVGEFIAGISQGKVQAWNGVFGSDQDATAAHDEL